MPQAICLTNYIELVGQGLATMLVMMILINPNPSYMNISIWEYHVVALWIPPLLRGSVENITSVGLHNVIQIYYWYIYSFIIFIIYSQSMLFMFIGSIESKENLLWIKEMQLSQSPISICKKKGKIILFESKSQNIIHKTKSALLGQVSLKR